MNFNCSFCVGIGRALAHALGEAGCSVVIADINATTAATVASELEAKNIQSFAVKVDISKKEEVDAMMEAILAKFGNLHIACNNAGIASQSKGEETEEVEWDTILGVNLKGTFHCCQVSYKIITNRRCLMWIKKCIVKLRLANLRKQFCFWNLL